MSSLDEFDTQLVVDNGMTIDDFMFVEEMEVAAESCAASVAAPAAPAAPVAPVAVPAAPAASYADSVTARPGASYAGILQPSFSTEESTSEPATVKKNRSIARKKK